jgi:hypothetical protein
MMNSELKKPPPGYSESGRIKALSKPELRLCSCQI